MPMYTYRCCECEHEDTEFRQMKNATAVGSCVQCPKCGGSAYQRIIDLPHTDLKEFHKPIEMFSIGMEDAEEIKAFKRQCPDVDVSTDEADPLYGVPVARSRHAKLQALKAAKFVETN